MQRRDFFSTVLGFIAAPQVVFPGGEGIIVLHDKEKISYLYKGKEIKFTSEEAWYIIEFWRHVLDEKSAGEKKK